MSYKKQSFNQKVSNAVAGICVAFKEESNLRLHFVMTVVVLLAGFFFQISLLEYVLILFAIGLVVTVELLNTSLENFSDFFCKEENINIKKIKDVSAGAVLVASLVAAVIGLLIFLPKLTLFFIF